MAKILLLVAFGCFVGLLALANALPAPPPKPVAIHHGQHNHLSQRQQLILEQQQQQKQLQLERANQRANDLPPSLSDSLAVAKSPLEPVTMPFNSPAARNDELVSTTTLAGQPHLQFERSTTLQGQDESSSNSVSETTSFDRSTTLGFATSTPTTSAPEEAASTELPQTTPTSTETTESESSATEASTTESPATTASTTVGTSSSAAITEAPSSEESSSARPAERQDDEALSTSTTSKPTSSVAVVELTATTEAPTTPKPTPDESATTTTESPRVTSITELSTSSLADSSTEPSATTSAPLSSTTAESASSAATEEPTTTTTTTTSTTTSRAPIAVEPATSAPAIEVSSLKPTSAPSPPVDEPAEEKDNQANANNKRPCNHLPTYDSEEIQKVFREETTYKNGTIKGKFTYINFDQRYRLVHYTRLPYGPVKIDLVEELGRPEQANGSSAGGSNVVELPNAVLQLRNILPNSLFGFPFLSSNPASSQQQAMVATNGHDNDKSSMYFYSTDTIATPNLLSGSVPVSVLPGQRRLSQPVNVPVLSNGDTLSASYFENLQVSANNKAVSGPRLLQKNETSEASTAPTLSSPPTAFFGQSNQNQFQYAYANAAANVAHAVEPLKQPAGLLYNYLAQPQAQYQYSPVPLYTFSQPSYFYSQTTSPHQLPAQQAALPTIYANNKLKAPQVPSSSPAFSSEAVLVNAYTTPQSHQLHSHEHYVAPFMHTQPQIANLRASGPTSRSLEAGHQVAEAPKLKLKVKNAKALAASNQQRQREIQQQYEARQAKSAQLRVAPVSALGARPINSPAQIHRVQQQHRQRIGKQNQQLRASPGAVNSTPVVYHVLRNPAGEMYSSIPYYGRTQLVQ